MSVKKFLYLQEYEPAVVEWFRKGDYEGCNMVIHSYQMLLEFAFYQIINEKDIDDKVKKMRIYIFERLLKQRRKIKSFKDITYTVYLLFRERLDKYYKGKTFDKDAMMNKAELFHAILFQVDALPNNERIIFRFAMVEDDAAIAKYFFIKIKEVMDYKKAAVTAIQKGLRPDAKAFFNAFIEHHCGFDYESIEV